MNDTTPHSSFEWDEAKAQRNQVKHAVSFRLASRVFEDPDALMLQDRVEDGEERWQAIGRVGSYTILVVAHVVRLRSDEEVIRILSARHALKYERQRYESEAI
jgi:uncharacterized DUF497 family protein